MIDAALRVMIATEEALHNPQSLEVVGVTATNVLKRMLSHAGSGEVYGNHRASAPGEPPAVDTGRLRNSIDFGLGADAAGAYVDVGSSVEYAPLLEFGTSRMAPRPYMRPSVAEVRTLLPEAVAAEILAAQVRVIASMPPIIVLED